MDPITIIFALVAAFFMFRLVSVLGTRTGHERRPDLKTIEGGRAEAAEERRPEDAPPSAPAPSFPGSDAVLAADPDFDPETFLAGARGAYEMIVTATARGDLSPVRQFIAPKVLEAFEAYIAQRAERGETAEVQIIGLEDAKIDQGGVKDGAVRIAVAFRSDQTRVTRNAAGEVVAGDPSRVDLVKDRWTFERDAKSRDPNWTLVATGAG
ncbi:MAG: Tim44/TimA family putative adaptor protein [Pseudomonadota bacterium]